MPKLLPKLPAVFFVGFAGLEEASSEVRFRSGKTKSKQRDRERERRSRDRGRKGRRDLKGSSEICLERFAFSAFKFSAASVVYLRGKRRGGGTGEGCGGGTECMLFQS